MTEKQNCSSSQPNRSAPEAVVATPEQKPPTSTGLTASPLPPPASLPVVAANPNLSQVAPESKLTLSAPAVILDQPQVQCDDVTKAKDIAPGVEVIKVGAIMDIDSDGERSAQTVSAPVVAATPECQSHEIIHSPSNNPLPSPSTTPLPQALPGGRPQPQSQTMRHQGQGQPQEAHTCEATSKAANVRFETMLTVPDDIRDSLLFWEGETILFERVSTIAIALDIVSHHYVQCMAHFSWLNDLRLQLYEAPTHIMVTPDYYCVRMLDDLFVIIRKLRLFIKSLIEKLGLEVSICSTFRKATERSYLEVQRASANHESSILGLRNRINIMKELETRIQAVVNGGPSTFYALQKPWHTILRQSLSSSDQAMTSSSPSERAQDRKDDSGGSSMKTSQYSPGNAPIANNQKTKTVSQSASAKNNSGDVAASSFRSPTPENPRASDSGDHTDEVEPVSRGPPEPKSKLEKKGGEHVEEKADAAVVVAETIVLVPQPSGPVGTEHRLSTQVSSPHNRKHSSLGRGDRAEGKNVAPPVIVNLDRTTIGPRGSPFPKSHKSIQAYGDIASLAEAYQPKTARNRSGPHPTSQLPEVPIMALVPKIPSILPPKSEEKPPPSEVPETTDIKTQQKQSRMDVHDNSEKDPENSPSKQVP